ncbi:MAG: ferrous iron transport protein A [Kofleriaceae bacterium]|nr:ferrous iron transport protein A [Kofleriaceae bacterium]MCL4226276.1 ferrous iron transport protein A [Myxococcales bacterium]
MSSLADVGRHVPVTIASVDGERSFRRRLLEMGLVPGTRVTVTNVAPLGDPLEIEVRRGRLSIRRHEAAHILVTR